ncbi:MAG TPA: 3-phosphoshikimate 1-carboxyvinyltransferase [Spirochaetota bacterium]|nr:3-phosphoshikimate 1-carboxyvinyltransferase [Spirochaetota bacterium]
MKFRVNPSGISGEVAIPGSKSHTIRALVFALLGDGVSEIKLPLSSSDTESCVSMVAGLGASIVREEGLWRVSGTSGAPRVPDNVIDVGNSGTTLYIGLGVASLTGGCVVFTGDHQIRNRPADSLISCINDLGAEAFSTRGNGKPPVVIRGRIRGGRTSVNAVTSQYLTSLLIAAPLAAGETTISVPLLNEAPYVTMTLAWLDRLGIKYENRDYREFRVPGGQKYPAFSEYIAADFSSATFFLVAAAVTGAELVLRGLDFGDTQGDKEVVNILKKMGAKIDIGGREIRIKGGSLRGGTFDLNSMPDSLPALAVAGCAASGETRLVNVAQARVKETDRIAVMCGELKKMGADIEELPDGLVIRNSRLRGCGVDGHHDHRIVMALAVAGLIADGATTIGTAEAVSVTFPDFMELMKGIGADIELLK